MHASAMIRPALLRSWWWDTGSAASPVRHRQPSVWFAVLLALAMLWAQVAGVLHRIEHAGGVPQGHVATQSSALAGEASPGSWGETPGHAGDGGSLSPLHSCVLFDGLCMTDGLATATLPVDAPHLPAAVSPAQGFLSWDSFFVGHFLSRGPPAV